jgi:hypothetical protein
MTVVVDTSVLIDVLRGRAEAAQVLREARLVGPIHASEVTRLEVLAGMRPAEEVATREFLRAFVWHPLDENLAEIAGEVGRRWLPAHRGIDAADLIIAATAIALDAELFTLNLKHFPMFSKLTAPY